MPERGLKVLIIIQMEVLLGQVNNPDRSVEDSDSIKEGSELGAGRVDSGGQINISEESVGTE